MSLPNRVKRRLVVAESQGASCLGKRSFDDLATAKAELRRLVGRANFRHRPGHELIAYECKACGRVHHGNRRVAG